MGALLAHAMRPLIGVLLLIASIGAARAHDEFSSVAFGWNLDPWIALPLAASGLLSGIGLGLL